MIQVENGISAISQQTYIRELLDCFGIKEASPIVCPMNVNIHVQKTMNINFPYWALVESVIYLVASTRHGIANI